MMMNSHVGDKSLDNLKRMEVSPLVVLPEGNIFLTHLRTPISKFENFCTRWMGHEMSDPMLQGVKEVLHLLFLFIR